MLVSCEAPAHILRARVAERHRAGHDASEADVNVLERQMEWQERPAPDEEADCIHVDTQADRAALLDRCQSLAEALTQDHR
jgi:predicted kinase